MKPWDVPLRAVPCPSRESRGSVRILPLPSPHPCTENLDRPLGLRLKMQKGAVVAGIKGDEPCLPCLGSRTRLGLRQIVVSFGFLLAKPEEKRPLYPHIWSSWCWGGCASPIQLQSRRAFPRLSSALPERADSTAQVQTFSSNAFKL